MQSGTDQLCSHGQRQLVPEAPQLSFFSPHPKNSFLKKAVVNALAMTKPTLFSTVTRPSWKQDQGGVIWLPLGLKKEISGSWISLSPISTSPGGLLRPPFPPRQSAYQTAEPQLLPFCGALDRSDAFSPSARLGRLWQRHGAWLQPLESYRFSSESWGGNQCVCPASALPTRIGEVPLGRAEENQGCWQNQLCCFVPFFWSDLM